MDMGEWLRSIGLGQYEAALRDNEFDDDVSEPDSGRSTRRNDRRASPQDHDCYRGELSASAAAPAAAAGTERLPPIVKTTQTTARRRHGLLAASTRGRLG